MVLDQCTRDKTFVTKLTDGFKKNVGKDVEWNDNDFKVFKEAATACEEFNRVYKSHRAVVDTYFDEKMIELQKLEATFNQKKKN